jgi:hypothetical protein
VLTRQRESAQRTPITEPAMRRATMRIVGENAAPMFVNIIENHCAAGVFVIHASDAASVIDVAASRE